MARAAAEPGERLEDAAERSQSPVKPRPLPLDPMLSAGATFFGSHVRSVKLELADGRVMQLDIGPKVIDEDDEPPENGITDKQRNILMAIEEMAIGEVASAETILFKAGHPNTGKSRDFLKRLAAFGILRHDRLGWERAK